MDLDLDLDLDLDSGAWTLDPGLWSLDSGFLDSGFWNLGFRTGFIRLKGSYDYPNQGLRIDWIGWDRSVISVCGR